MRICIIKRDAKKYFPAIYGDKCAQMRDNFVVLLFIFKTVKPMRIQKTIDYYCRLYGVNSHTVDLAKTQCFVTISPDGLRILPLHKPSKLLGQIIGSAMKRGEVLYVRNNRATVLTWDNWKGTWSRLFAPNERKNTAPEPNILRPYKSEMFETMQQKRAPKKPQKNGFEGTYRANKSLHLLSIVS